MPASGEPAAETRARPKLLPATTRQRVCLGLLLAFVLVKGLVWGITMPYFWGPDEDYHFVYAERLAVQHAIPDPKQPNYPNEYNRMVKLTRYHEFGTGPRTTYFGDPKAALHRLANLPRSDRVGRYVDRGVGVIHPPLYHLAAAGADRALGDSSLFSRMQAMRFVTTLFSVLAVYFAWVLAAQVLARFREQIVAAFLVALQPIFSFLSGIVNHDAALIAFSTAALAMMLFMLRTAPRAAQGGWLGGALVLALLVKASALALVPIAALAYLAQWFTWPAERRAVLRSAAIAIGTVLVLAGWWYVRAKIVYGSFTGATTAYTIGGDDGTPPIIPDAGLLDYARETKNWLGLTYRSYWFHHLWFDAPWPRQSIWWWVPVGVASIGVVGAFVKAWECRRTLLSPDNPLLRQMLLVGLSLLAIMLPFLAVDLIRYSNGEGFFAPAGRYLMPGFAGAAAIYVVGVCRLFRGRARTPALAAIAIAALLLQWRVYDHHIVVRYFGDVPWGVVLRRITFDRPEFVTPTSLKVLAVVTLGLLVAFLYSALWPDRDEPRGAH